MALDFNFDIMSDDQLRDIATQCTALITKRSEQAKKEAWNKVYDSIKAYCSRYGRIQIQGEDYFTSISQEDVFKEQPGIFNMDA